MTLKKLRHELEEDMGLERDALKEHKAFLSSLIDKVRQRTALFSERKTLLPLRCILFQQAAEFTTHSSTNS
jgi:hypothetical protein